MNNTVIRFVLLIIVTAFPAFPAFSREKPEFDFNLDVGIGARTFNEGEEQVTYQNLTLAPAFTIGRFGFGLSLNINFTFTGGDTNDRFVIRRDDWVIDSPDEFLPVYLPKIKFIRWAEKGAPLYVYFGQIENGTLGNGFIMSGYTNTQFLPELPVFGLSFDMDGELYKFPYTGIETFVGNLGIFDVMGGRFYLRPLSFIENSFVRELQLGVTVAGDRLPLYYLPDGDVDGDGAADTAVPVLIIGTDFRLPILSGENFTLSTFGDLVFENLAKGGMLGVGGEIFKMVPYRAEIRFIGTGFIPVYFDETYDLFRADKYLLLSGTEKTPAHIGWFLSTGITLFEDRIIFLVSADGPFGHPVTTTINGIPPEDNFQNYPHLRVSLATSEKLFPIFIEASYDKRLIRTGSDLVSPENAVIGARLGFKLGPAVLSVHYKLRHRFSPSGGDDWETVSGIDSLISFF